MLESDLVELECFQRGQCHRVLRFWLHRHSENLFEVVERCFGLAIGVDHVSQFLKGTKNKKRIDKEREKLSDGNALRIDEIQHQKQDRSPQKIYDAALNKTEAAKVANLFKFQFENLIRGGVEAIDFLLRETETLYQFDVSQRRQALSSHSQYVFERS